MASDNTVYQYGRLQGKPTVTETKNGNHVANFTLVVDDEFIKDDGSKGSAKHYTKVEAWGVLAKACKSLKHKDYVSVSGRLRTSSWYNEEGQKRLSTRVVADRVCLDVLTPHRKEVEQKKGLAPDDDLPF